MTQLLREIFNHDFFIAASDEDFRTSFFAKHLDNHDLGKISAFVRESKIDIAGNTIPAAVIIPGRNTALNQGAPFAILAQLHGNEPAGLAGIALAMALSAAGKLERDCIGIIGNPLAAQQYFEAWASAPHARQETRDAYRCGLAPDGSLLPDMNRIPVDFMTRTATDHHTKRAQELYTMGQNVWGIVDIHSARGNMLCITDHKRDRDLKHSSIRSLLTGLAEAISAHASGAVTVRTLKTILNPLPTMESQTGIEAGRHEAPDTPYHAAVFTLSLLYTLGITPVEPKERNDSHVFTGYAVRPRMAYADLHHAPTLRAHDRVYMARSCHALASVPERCDSVIIRQGDDIFGLQSLADFIRKPAGTMAYAVYQYDEMEPITKGQVVAVALPSGTEFTAPSSFSGIFVSKSAALYDKDPSVGPWPVAADQISAIKFCYPCDVSDITLDVNL